MIFAVGLLIAAIPTHSNENRYIIEIHDESKCEGGPIMKNTTKISTDAVTENTVLAQTEIPDSVVQQLADDVANRMIDHALGILDEWDRRIFNLRLPQRNTAALAAYFAWAIDIIPSYVSIVEKLIHLFEDNVSKGAMTLLDLVYLDIAQGLVNLHHERYDEAIRQFELAKSGADRVQHHELMIVTRYYIGRGYLKNANHEKALFYIRSAKYLDDPAGRHMRVAVIESVEGLILLLLGKTGEAETLFDRAETTLRGNVASDNLVLGNLCLFRARIARRKGNYDEAEKLLLEGIAYYKQTTPQRNIARAYIHLASIYRLKALELEEEVCSSQAQKQIKQHRSQALAFLEKAEAIHCADCERYQQQIGKVFITRASVFFDNWQFGDAERNAKDAFDLGQQ